MEENKDGQINGQKQTEQKAQRPKKSKKNKLKAMDIVVFVGLGVMFACVIALFVLKYGYM